MATYSVIIPVYNCKDTIKECIASVKKQTAKPLEILVIDDRSTDGTFELLQKIAQENESIHLLRNEKNSGVAATRNRGLAQVRGEWVAFLDADDCWEPDKMALQIAALTRTGADFAYTGYRLVTPQGKQVGDNYRVPAKAEKEALLEENFIGCSSVVISQKIAAQYRFRGEYAHEDYVYWLEIVYAGKRGIGINKPLMGYRLSPNSRSRDKKKAAYNRWVIYRRFLKFGRLRAAYYFSCYGMRAIKNIEKLWKSKKPLEQKQTFLVYSEGQTESLRVIAAKG